MLISCSSDHQMTLYARCPIPTGSVIYYSYCSPLLPTNLRRLMLYTGKKFSCECQRCQDPEEMGSNVSAWLCSRCKEERGKASLLLPESPLDLQSVWTCEEEECQEEKNGMEVMTNRLNFV